jgi:hypothetical protein
MGDGMSETAPEAPAGTAPAAGTETPSSPPTPATLAAAIHGGTVSPDPDAIDTSEEGLQELARARKEGTDDEKLIADAKWWKAQSRRTEQRLREANTRLTELDDRDKSELQKATDRAAKAEARAVKAEIRIWTADAAESYQIPAKFRNRITGSTQDEIETSAEGLAKDLEEMKAELSGQQGGQPAAGQRPAARPGRRPVESLRSGAAPSANGGGGSGSGNDIMRDMINRARGR